ncbi:MAG TPA: hypothetical protein VKB10_06235 [Gaiellaceae bacterium]|nr:hypothetical protein [Gaiellaceae bacterium]
MRSAERRSIGWGVVAGSALASFVAVSAAFAGLTSLASGGPQTIVTKRIFPGARTVPAQDLRDASSGVEANKSDAYSYADASVATTSTAIAANTNRYLELTFSSARAGGLAVSSPLFNFRLASSGGAQAGNACFWFDVRSGGSVIGTHGSYASAAGCSTGTTQTTVSTGIPEVTSTDRANGLVVRVYPWETGTKAKTIDVDVATLTGSTAYASFTAYEIQEVDATSGAPTTAPWMLATVDATSYTTAGNWPSAAPVLTKYVKASSEASVPVGAVVTAVSLGNVWRASAAVTNGGTLCYYLETFNGATSLATHGSAASPFACTSSGTTFRNDTVPLPEVNDVTKANNLVVRLYYWLSPICGGAGNPTCVKSVTDQLQVTYSYYLD